MSVKMVVIMTQVKPRELKEMNLEANINRG